MANDLAHRIAQLWLAAAGLLIAAVAFLIPAHISGIDSRVLDIVGEKGPTLTALAAFGFVAALIALTFIDLDTFLLPDSITLPLVWAGLLVNLILGPNAFTDLRSSVIGAIMGAVLFRLLVAIAIRMGLDANDLKLVTAVVVLAAIVGPGQIKELRTRRARREGRHAAA